FAVIFLANRQLRAFATFAGAGLAVALASLALGGLALHGEFLGLMADMRGATVLSPVNPSLLAVLMAAASLLGLAAPLDLAANSTVMAPVPGWLATGLLLLGAGLAFELARRLQAQEPLRRQAILLFAIAIIIPLFGPVGWQHYYLLPLLLSPGMVAFLPPRSGLRLMVPLYLLSFKYLSLQFKALPWPTLTLVTASVAIWLVILAALWIFSRQGPARDN
ncbi:MAG: hypothetical protein WBA91_09065, partial [Paracoccaceae bacterium]